MNLFAVRKQLDRLLYPLVSRLARLPLAANHWTLIGALVGVGSGVLLYAGRWWPGLVLLVARGLIDNLDGFVARHRRQVTTFGAVMDDVTDRWVLGVVYAGGCLNVAGEYPHVLLVLPLGLTGALVNVIVKLSIYAESQQDVVREAGKLGHPIDVVGLFGSAEFLIYFGFGVLLTAAFDDVRPLVAGIWAVMILAHVSLAQRIVFAWRRYRDVAPAGADPEGP